MIRLDIRAATTWLNYRVCHCYKIQKSSKQSIRLSNLILIKTRSHYDSEGKLKPIPSVFCCRRCVNTFTCYYMYDIHFFPLPLLSQLSAKPIPWRHWMMGKSNSFCHCCRIVNETLKLLNILNRLPGRLLDWYLANLSVLIDSLGCIWRRNITFVFMEWHTKWKSSAHI